MKSVLPHLSTEAEPLSALVASLVPVARKRPSHGQSGFGVIEYNLSRKGVWSIDVRKGVVNDPLQDAFEFTGHDVVGTIEIKSPLGRLSTYEMRLVMFVLGRWRDQRRSDDPWVRTSAHEIADALGVQWSGDTAKRIVGALKRIKGVSLYAEMWSAAQSPRHVRHIRPHHHQRSHRREGGGPLRERADSHQDRRLLP